MLVVFLSALLMIFFLIARLVYLMIFDAAYYQQKAKTLHEREREIKAARGEIIDRNGKVLATNKAVCTISVIHSQITDPERVIQVLADELGIEKEMIRKRIEKVSSREKIKTNVEKETGDRIRAYELDGVKVDEDFKRYYPYDNLASKVLGFTGGDNQGIIGLEVKYENYLKGVNGMILTTTDARGIELADTLEDRVEPVSGDTLQVSLDYNIQEYAQQAAEKVMEEKQADAVVILILNPKTGEIYACVNAPEFDLNAPFTLPEGTDAALNDEEKQENFYAHLQELKDREKLLREALATAESQEDIQTYMTQLLANALEVRNTVSDRRYSDVILAAQKIIKKQYMSEDISLNTVAAEVGMSASYFSTIFSREMNQTFVEYLTEIRMNKAKELLTCSSLKTAEIAFETGYRDPHYFSSLFKKTQGCTPKEYRASRKG